MITKAISGLLLAVAAAWAVPSGILAEDSTGIPTFAEDFAGEATAAAAAATAFAATAVAEERAASFADMPEAIDAFSKDVAAKTHGRTVAVAPFLPLGPNVRDKKLGDIAAELLATRLVKAGGPTVIERGQLDRILEETKLSLLGLTDAANASKVGQMVGADLVLVGSVSETGEQLSISVRAVDTATGEAQAAWEARFPAATTELLAAQYVVKKSRTDALFRSLLIPGWGQAYNDQDVKAGVFFGAGLGLVGLSVVETIRYNQSRDDYDNADSTPAAVASYDRMEDLDRERRIAYLVTGLFWGANAVEAFVSGSSSSSVRVEAAAPTGGGTGLQIAFRY
jgi:TolB-like protein